MTSSDLGHTTRQPPVAMFGGSVATYWYLNPGSRGDYPWVGPHLATFHGSHDDARRAAQAWCDEHGYYLSAWSDADDRVPDSECICDPYEPAATTPGCPMHRPDVPRRGSALMGQEHPPA